MSASSETQARIEALEAANAHQERVIAELSDAVAAQWSRVDALTREVLRLREEIQGLSQAVAPDRPPPHY
ncbi:SlyX family protein [Rhodoblastus acidophilus]|uniref:SlyX family protein n=1 Tax=Candidatus Rhodoblastus alkanivorans TaxID=2954117 RepID=A0ABS9Z5P1_9HYPH|nr:SlyX family protein [Candidatus Rhodoblastus alkanivorans]MCI4680583.1 SlyX family protein [Candidatus Rhodoblastus alkanivorans]MCI4682502.1 SlyX family protein [Candidatus Rhodoblastus alkanivorans]MDI4639808.1 SlyX family protein [Rhodoblastus acidophilus]